MPKKPVATNIARRYQVPVQARIVCSSCGHLHRRLMVGKCDCCTTDIQDYDMKSQS